jgi:hypothetical protein
MAATGPDHSAVPRATMVRAASAVGAAKDPEASPMQVDHEIEVGRPAAEVFAFLADGDSFRVVDPALIESSWSGPLRQGATGTFVHRRGGMRARTSWTVVELDAPRRLSVAIRGAGYEMDETATLDDSATGTRLRFVDTVRPTSILGRLLVLASPGIMRRDLRSRAARLKAALEEPGDGDRGGTSVAPPSR